MDLQERINSCPSFAAGECPHQPLMERAYLIPQLMKHEELEACERLLCTCDRQSGRGEGDNRSDLRHGAVMSRSLTFAPPHPPLAARRG